MATAQALCTALAERAVEGYLVPLGDRVAISLWHGLVAWTDGRMIWWQTPHPSSRGRRLTTYAYAPAAAADRLAIHYATVTGRSAGTSLPADTQLWRAAALPGSHTPAGGPPG